MPDVSPSLRSEVRPGLAQWHRGTSNGLHELLLRAVAPRWRSRVLLTTLAAMAALTRSIGLPSPRGIAMAQLGDLVRAKALWHGAARAFGPKEARARRVVPRLVPPLEKRAFIAEIQAPPRQQAVGVNGRIGFDRRPFGCRHGLRDLYETSRSACRAPSRHRPRPRYRRH